MKQNKPFHTIHELFEILKKAEYTFRGANYVETKH